MNRKNIAIGGHIQSNLTNKQKKAVLLLSIGTFLEYFDLMLYIHMMVVLNELFFPKYDPHAAQLLLSFTFCATYLLRPIGALIFGWIGDNVGRKSTVIITTFMMAISCLIIANLPTYAEIGITAAVIVSICRIVQGMSSMGEIIGAILYLSETIKPPQQYPAVSLLAFLSALGGTFALGIASMAISYNFNWRYAFWFGASVALIGSVARTTLRETPEFIDAKRRMKRIFADINEEQDILKNDPIWTKKVDKITALSLFLMSCMWPVCFYLTFIHCGEILRNNFGYKVEQVMYHNFCVSVVEILGALVSVYLSYYIYPIVILKIRLVIFWGFILIYPYLLNNVRTPFDILLLQSFMIFFAIHVVPATPIFYKYFPIFKRFTYCAFIHAMSRTVMYVITSFGLIYLTEYLGNYGLLIITIPIMIGYSFGILHFEKLEKTTGNYPKKKKWFLLMN
ncbi:MFS transporter [Candidatus Tisiphia endosymbiont of Mystacides longicornis]|uniref:MFS transporter n=1 Tax=Candidatus Tisiphia endosymbiont of Mystacides longicornis TaxID=3139330 RepID=UPI003CCB1C9D